MLKNCISCNYSFTPSIGSKGLYCSIKCSAKSKNSGQLQAKERADQYSLNPNFCLECKNSLPYAKKASKYCNHSCSAKSTNKLRASQGWCLTEKSKRQISKSLSLKKSSMLKWCKICGYANSQKCPNS